MEKIKFSEDDKELYKRLLEGRTLSRKHKDMIKRVIKINPKELVLISSIKNRSKNKGPLLGIFEGYDEKKNFGWKCPHLEMVFAEQPWFLTNITLPGNIKFSTFVPRIESYRKREYGYSTRLIDKLEVGKEDILRSLKNDFNENYENHAEIISKMNKPYVDMKTLEGLAKGN